MWLPLILSFFMIGQINSSTNPKLPHQLQLLLLQQQALPQKLQLPPPLQQELQQQSPKQLKSLQAIQRLADGRIVGGNNIEIQNVNYQVSFQYTGSHICGGSIINTKFIVTAAHCLIYYNYIFAIKSFFKIRVGSTHHGFDGVLHDIAELKRHPEYNSYSLNHDIALVKLSVELKFNLNIGPIMLSKNRPIDNVLAQVSGWGTQSEFSNNLSFQLQTVELNIISNEKCILYYGGNEITDFMICAGTVGGGKDSCQGDSGGPLVVGAELVGIVSWGYGCARAYYPGVYTSVAEHYEWIQSHIS